MSFSLRFFLSKKDLTNTMRLVYLRRNESSNFFESFHDVEIIPHNERMFKLNVAVYFICDFI